MIFLPLQSGFISREMVLDGVTRDGFKHFRIWGGVICRYINVNASEGSTFVEDGNNGRFKIDRKRPLIMVRLNCLDNNSVRSGSLRF